MQRHKDMEFFLFLEKFVPSDFVIRDGLKLGLFSFLSYYEEEKETALCL